jgi:hypothetical protein
VDEALLLLQSADRVSGQATGGRRRGIATRADIRLAGSRAGKHGVDDPILTAALCNIQAYETARIARQSRHKSGHPDVAAHWPILPNNRYERADVAADKRATNAP